MDLMLKAGPVTDQWLLAIMCAVFNDYIHVTDASEFQRRFGTVGTEALARGTERDTL